MAAHVVRGNVRRRPKISQKIKVLARSEKTAPGPSGDSENQDVETSKKGQEIMWRHRWARNRRLFAPISDKRAMSNSRELGKAGKEKPNEWRSIRGTGENGLDHKSDRRLQERPSARKKKQSGGEEHPGKGNADWGIWTLANGNHRRWSGGTSSWKKKILTQEPTESGT